MSKGPNILNPSSITSETSVLIPSQITQTELVEIASLLKDRQILWLIEENGNLEADVKSFIENQGGKGAVFSAEESDPKALGQALKQDVGNGGIIVFVPGEVIAHPGSPCHVPTSHLRILTQLDIPLLPLAVHYPKDFALSINEASSSSASIMVFGDVISKQKANVYTFRENLLKAYETAFSSRKFLKGSITLSLLEGLKKWGNTGKVYDGTDDSETGYDKILGAAIALSKEIRKATKKKRVGIILPPGKGGLVANIAVFFAGKVPVNLNFTASHAAVRSAIRQADLDRFITADPFVRKVPSFPWPANRELIHIERVLPRIKKQIIKWVVISKFLPVPLLAKLIGINSDKGDDEATLLFTSGSSGEPKGVSLSHTNLLANVCQFGTRLSLPKESKILGCLPLFHSFGCTVTLWYPIIEGINLVTYPSPLETKRLAELIDTYKISLLLSTPTFLRGFMRRVEPSQMESLSLVVTGAEKLPESLAKAFQKKFGLLPLEGYGLTETSPATNANLTDPKGDGNKDVIPSLRFGSVGHFLPGLAVKMTNPATDEPMSLNESGIIWLKGPNVFQGYLGKEELSKDVLEDGWFRTGDVGRVDEDGFLYIEGRISRFSKIAGEMVPHETVEASVNEALGLDSEAERKIAIVGIPDEKKGEAIILLSTIAGSTLDQECIDLRYKLMDAGTPSLWCPKEIVKVDEIPVLASGKLDLKACQEAAESTGEMLG